MRFPNMAKAKIYLTQEGTRTTLYGPPAPIIGIKDDLKALGFYFDGNLKKWWTRTPSTNQGFLELQAEIEALLDDNDHIRLDVKKLIPGRIQEEDLFLLRAEIEAVDPKAKAGWDNSEGGWSLLVQFSKQKGLQITEAINDWVKATKALRAPKAHEKTENHYIDLEVLEFQLDRKFDQFVFAEGMANYLLGALEPYGARLIEFDPREAKITTAVYSDKASQARQKFEGWKDWVFETLSNAVEGDDDLPDEATNPSNTYFTVESDDLISRNIEIELTSALENSSIQPRNRSRYLSAVPFLSDKEGRHNLRVLANYERRSEQESRSRSFRLKNSR